MASCVTSLSLQRMECNCSFSGDQKHLSCGKDQGKRMEKKIKRKKEKKIEKKKESRTVRVC